MADHRRPQWRLLRDGVTDPFMHFAVEEAILRGVDEGTSPETLRLRQVEQSVFIGIYQEPDEDVNLAWCEERGIKIVRRQNPGGAVYQDQGSFCYSATFRREQFERWGMMDAAGLYEKAGRAVVNTCAAFGATAKARPVNDVEINGRKVYGSAQIDWYGAFVHSGTFLVHTDVDAMSQALNPSMLKFADKGSSSIRERVVNMAEAVGRELEVGAVMSALTLHLGEELGVELVPGGLTDEELSSAKRLLDSKYGRREWTFRGKQAYATIVSAKARSGVVTLETNIRGEVLEAAHIHGDFLIADQRQLETLLTRLRGTALQDAPEVASRSDLPDDVRETVCRLLREIKERV